MVDALITADAALVVRLEDRIASLERELADKDRQIQTLQRGHAAAVKNLRRQLSPLYTALQQVFGEIDAVVGDDGSVSSGSALDARTKAIWDSWKQRLGGACAKMIDALLLQPGMTNRQIATAIGTGRIQTVYDAVAKMNKNSLLVKNGDRYSLREV